MDRRDRCDTGISTFCEAASSISTGAVNAPSASLSRGRRLAAAERDAEREIARLRAGAGQDQVAEAGKARQGFAARAAGAAEPHQFAEAARGQRRQRRGAELACRRRFRRRSPARFSPRRRSRRRARPWCDRAGRSAEPSACTSALASVSSFAASVTAVGSPRATSSAKLGPDRIAGIASGAASAITSVMNWCVPRSMPLAQAMTGVAAGEMRRKRGRPPRADAAPASRSAMISARAGSAMSCVTTMLRSRRTPGSRGLSRVAAIAAAVAASRAYSVDLAPGARGDAGQRRAPGAGADHGKRELRGSHREQRLL